MPVNSFGMPEILPHPPLHDRDALLPTGGPPASDRDGGALCLALFALTLRCVLPRDELYSCLTLRAMWADHLYATSYTLWAQCVLWESSQV